MSTQLAWEAKLCLPTRVNGCNSHKRQARQLHTGALTYNRAGDLQCQATAHKPCQSDNRPPRSPDISLLSPELQQQWHVDSNMHLGAIQVKPNSQHKAVWQGDQCPAGQPHIWTARVATRTRGWYVSKLCTAEATANITIVGCEASLMSLAWKRFQGDLTCN
ncbi:hypothetical protein ABBQ38_013428 [Trebouxia sp. C0009 RCD-2024]